MSDDLSFSVLPSSLIKPSSHLFMYCCASLSCLFLSLTLLFPNLTSVASVHFAPRFQKHALTSLSLPPFQQSTFIIHAGEYKQASCGSFRIWHIHVFILFMCESFFSPFFLISKTTISFLRRVHNNLPYISINITLIHTYICYVR